MNFSRFCVTLTCSLLVFTAASYAAEPATNTPGPTGPAPASSETAALLPESDEDIPVEIIPRLDNAVSFGLRRLTKGPKVKFGNLGQVRHGDVLVGTDGITKIYSNGSIVADAAGYDELWRLTQNDADTTTYDKTETPVARPQDGTKYINANGVTVSVLNGIITTYTTVTESTTTATPHELVVGKSRAYKEGETRTWSYASANQVQNRNIGGVDTQTVGMSMYNVESAGASIEADGGPSSGFELKFERRLGRLGSRLEVGVSSGFSLSDINAQTDGLITATLKTTTDYYKLFGSGGAIPALSQPSGSAVDIKDSYIAEDKTVVEYPTTGGDTSGSTTLKHGVADTSNNGAGEDTLIYGVWKLKGSYYHLRVGPTFRFHFTERLALSGSIGAAIAWVGTTYSVEETAINVETASAMKVTEENETHKFVPGWYGELNAEFWATERTGFYAGVTYQAMREFTQRPLSGRTAKIDLGNSSGFQFGIITRF